MAIERILIEKKRLGRHDALIGYLRDGDVVKKAMITIPRNTQPTTMHLQAAWQTGEIVPNGLDEWAALQLRETEPVYDAVIRAMLNQLRDGGGVPEGGTLAQITNAGKAALVVNTQQTQALTRLTNLFKAATPAQQAEFLMLFTILTQSKLGKR